MNTQMLGTKLRALRTEKQWSLRKAEEMTGVSFATISRTERGASMPDTIILCMLAKGYGVDVESLLDDYEPTGEETEAFLIDYGYDLEQLRTEINALIDKLKADAIGVFAAKRGDKQ